MEAAQCVGSLCTYLSDTQLHHTLATHVLDQDGVSDWAVLQARATTLSTALLVASSRIAALGLRKVVTRCVISLATSDRIPVCESGLRCLGSFVSHMEGDGEEMVGPLCQVCQLGGAVILGEGDFPQEKRTPYELIVSVIAGAYPCHGRYQGGGWGCLW